MWQSANTNAASAANTAMAIQTSPNKKRSDCGDAFESAPATVLVGDGNPHQNWYNQQMTVRQSRSLDGDKLTCSLSPTSNAATRLDVLPHTRKQKVIPLVGARILAP
jgi:hypothetical protein